MLFIDSTEVPKPRTLVCREMLTQPRPQCLGLTCCYFSSSSLLLPAF